MRLRAVILAAVCVITPTLSNADAPASLKIVATPGIPNGVAIAKGQMTIEGLSKELCVPYDPDHPPSIRVEFRRRRPFSGFRIRTHFHKSLAALAEHGRVAEVQILTDWGAAPVPVYDIANQETHPAIPIAKLLGTLSSFKVGWFMSKTGAIEPAPTKSTTITVTKVYPGTQHNDVCLSALSLFEEEN